MVLMMAFVGDFLFGRLLPERFTGLAIQAKDDELVHLSRLFTAPKSASTAALLTSAWGIC